MSSSSQNGIFPFASSVMNKILRWRQGDEDETWKNRAFLTLEKKLKKKNDGSYEAFFFVALEQKNSDTQCVTLDRSQDGRLQVSHRKMLPHVLCCRIVRWPDLQTHQELKSVDNCKYPGHQKLSKVCINPYHYSRVDQPIYPPVFTPNMGGGSFSVSPSLSPPAPFSYSSGLPIDYHSQVASMSPQSFSGPPSSSYVSALSPDAQSYDAATPGYYQDNVDMDHSGYQHVPKIAPEMPISFNSNVWCRITYWELSSRVGEPFTASSSAVTIDGFTDPTNHNQRFSLGSLSNINRNSVIESTRKAIGRGVRLEKKGNEIWAKNLSAKPVYFHSRNYNCYAENNFLEQTVIRMPPDCQLKIFDYKVFEEQVRREINSPENNYDKLLSLNSHWSIKMSFVKGWGAPYQRHEVTSTPCWLEIILCEMQSYLDAKLREFVSPKYHITSTS